MYIPLAGLLIAAAWGIGDIATWGAGRRTVAIVVAAVFLAAMTMATRLQTTHWQNSLTLFRRALDVTTENSIAQAGYGQALYEAGQTDDAVIHLKEAIRIDSSFADARNNLGKVLLREGKVNEAITHFMELIRQGRGTVDVHYNLGVALGMQGSYAEAAEHFKTVLEIEPQYPAAYKRLGAALLAAGKASEAVRYLEEALEADPKNAENHTTLGLVYAKGGKPELAKQHWNRAIELAPDNAEVVNNAVWMWVTNVDMSQSEAERLIVLAERIAKNYAGGESAQFLDTLAAAYAAAGRFTDAAAASQEALNAAIKTGKEHEITEIRKRLKMYQEGRTYREK